jgi:hypothetical protein
MQQTMISIRSIPKPKKIPAGILFVLAAIVSLISCANRRKNDTSTTQSQQELKTNKMETVLIIGINPNTIDFTNPELPKGLTKEIVEQGIKAALEKLNSMGYQAEAFLLDTGSTDLGNLANQLKNKNYSGVVIGNGIRGQAANFILFEQIINVVHENAPKSKIIFNTLPTNTYEAVKRWL